jgi:hypothetical protein
MPIDIEFELCVGPLEIASDNVELAEICSEDPNDWEAADEVASIVLIENGDALDSDPLIDGSTDWCVLELIRLELPTWLIDAVIEPSALLWVPDTVPAALLDVAAVCCVLDVWAALPETTTDCEALDPTPWLGVPDTALAKLLGNAAVWSELEAAP